MEFIENGKKIILKEGECAFIRRDIRIIMYKRSCKKSNYYQSILLRFTRKFLQDFYRKLEDDAIPTDITRSKASIVRMNVTPDIQRLFDSIKPFFNSAIGRAHV